MNVIKSVYKRITSFLKYPRQCYNICNIVFSVQGAIIWETFHFVSMSLSQVWIIWVCYFLLYLAAVKTHSTIHIVITAGLTQPSKTSYHMTRKDVSGIAWFPNTQWLSFPWVMEQKQEPIPIEKLHNSQTNIGAKEPKGCRLGGSWSPGPCWVENYAIYQWVLVLAIFSEAWNKGRNFMKLTDNIMSFCWDQSQCCNTDNPFYY